MYNRSVDENGLVYILELMEETGIQASDIDIDLHFRFEHVAMDIISTQLIHCLILYRSTIRFTNVLEVNK